MSKPLDNLMQKEMDRKEFLATVGFGLASLFGFSTVLQLLGRSNGINIGQAADAGYGSSAYGGNKTA
jgi:hypothetical protein